MKLFGNGFLILALLALPSQAFAQITVWQNRTGTTDWSTASNWDNGTPNAGVGAYITPGFQNIIGNQGFVSPGGSTNIVITNSTPGAAASFLRIYGNFNQPTGLSPITGTVSASFTGAGNTLTISNGAIVNGGDTLNFTGNLVVTAGDIAIGNGTNNNTGLDSTQAGNGTLNLNSGSLNFGTALLLGSGPANTGTFNQGVTATSTVAGSSADVIAGSTLVVGDGGIGNYTLNTASTLTSGVGGTTISIGRNSGNSDVANGTMSLNGSSQVTLGNGSSIEIGSSFGSISGGTGTFNQSDTSQVNLSGTASLEIGRNAGGVAQYNLRGGQLNIGGAAGDATVLDIGVGAPNTTLNATGILNQSGGTLTALASSIVTIGDAGQGTYNLSGGTADFQNGFTLGNTATGTGIVNQTGGTLTAENTIIVGNNGAGIYNLSGGSATFSNGVRIGAQGAVNQSGGTFTLNGAALDLSAVGSSYNLSRGTLQVGSSITGTTGQGRLNFAGGTLDIIAAGNFTLATDGTVTGISTITDTHAGADVTLAGILSGAGGLTLVGAPNTTFLLGSNVGGADTFRGPLSIMSGVLQVNSADIASTSSLNINAAAEADVFVGNGGLGYRGSLLGAGTLGVGFQTAGDALVVKNSSNFTGNVDLGRGGNAGTLQVYNGTFNNITDGSTGSGVTIGGASLVAGLTGLPATGTVTINNATYTGPTTVNSGFTLYATGLAGNLINNGVLGLIPASAVGTTFNIGGAMTLNAGSSLIIRAINTGTPTVDVYHTNSTATFSPNSTLLVTGTPGSGTFTVVSTNGGITGLPTVRHGFLLGVTDSIVGTDLVINTVQKSAASTAETPNEAAVGRTIDQTMAHQPHAPGQLAQFNRVLSGLNNLNSRSAVAQALEQLSPESLQYSRNIAFENSTFLVQRINSVDADLRNGIGGLDTNALSITAEGFTSVLGRSLTSLFASNSGFHPSAPNGVNYYPGNDSSGISDLGPTPALSSGGAIGGPETYDPKQVISDSAPAPVSSPRIDAPDTHAPPYNVFIGGDAVLADLNQDHSLANAPSTGASYKSGGGTAGIGFRITNNFAAGLLFDYAHTDAKTDANGSRTRIDSYTPGLYATYFNRGFYVNGMASFGYNTYVNERSIPFLGQRATSHPDGEQYTGNLDFGYDFHPNKEWIVGPTLGVTYTHLEVASFTETGASGANLAVDGQGADSVRSRLGGHVVYQTLAGNILFQPTLTAMWQHEFLADSSGITSSFHDFSSSPFTIQTAEPSRDSALIGAGVTASLGNSMAFYLNYLADVGASNYFAQTVYGGVQARF